MILMRRWMGCLGRCGDAAAARYPSRFVVAERRSTAAPTVGGAGTGAAGGGVREPGIVMGDGGPNVDRPAAGGSAGTGAPGAVAWLPSAADQQRPFAGRGSTVIALGKGWAWGPAMPLCGSWLRWP